MVYGNFKGLDGALYTSLDTLLHKMEERGWAEAEWASRTQRSAPSSIASPPPAAVMTARLETA